MKVLVLSLNGEVCEVFSSKERVIDFLEKSWDVKSLVFENDDDEEVEFSLEDGVDYLLKEYSKVRCFSEDLIERGDEYCEIELSEMEVI
jgi:hypothetical protein